MVMEPDSLFPALFEDYLAHFLPVGGAPHRFGFSPGGGATQQSSSTASGTR